MTLHLAIEKLLLKSGKAMSTSEIAKELNKNTWYTKKDKTKIQPFQIHGRTKNYLQLFNRIGSKVSLKTKSKRSITKTMKIPLPSPTQIARSLAKWDEQENYVLQERSLKKLFQETYPKNQSIDDVLIKVCSLNDFYSTNIFSPFKVAKHIISLGIDKNLENGDLKLVNRIAKVSVAENKKKNFYSFASKYCSHHKPTIYPIYDYYVERMLVHFRKQDHFDRFNRADLKSYPVFHKVISKFRTFYDLNNFDLKQIDKYLWIFGKEYFPRKY